MDSAGFTVKLLVCCTNTLVCFNFGEMQLTCQDTAVIIWKRRRVHSTETLQ